MSILCLCSTWRKTVWRGAIQSFSCLYEEPLYLLRNSDFPGALLTVKDCTCNISFPLQAGPLPVGNHVKEQVGLDKGHKLSLFTFSNYLLNVAPVCHTYFKHLRYTVPLKIFTTILNMFTPNDQGLHWFVNKQLSSKGWDEKLCWNDIWTTFLSLGVAFDLGLESGGKRVTFLSHPITKWNIISRKSSKLLTALSNPSHLLHWGLRAA